MREWPYYNVGHVKAALMLINIFMSILVKAAFITPAQVRPFYTATNCCKATPKP
jgi:hypothetical protein